MQTEQGINIAVLGNGKLRDQVVKEVMIQYYSWVEKVEVI